MEKVKKTNKPIFYLKENVVYDSFKNDGISSTILNIFSNFQNPSLNLTNFECLKRAFYRTLSDIMLSEVSVNERKKRIKASISEFETTLNGLEKNSNENCVNFDDFSQDTLLSELRLGYQNSTDEATNLEKN